MSCICLAGGIPYAYFVIPTPLRCGKVFDAAHDETQSPLGYPRNIKSINNGDYAGRLAHAVRNVIYSVVVNRRHPHRTGENPQWGARAYSFVACLSR